MKKIAIIRIDNMIDLITNSSSELFVIESKGRTAETLAELVNEALAGEYKVSPNDFESRFKKESSNYEMEWEIDNILENFPESDREMLREKYFSNGGNYFSIMFDRDWAYQNDYKVHNKLVELGFEFIGYQVTLGSDY